MSDSDAVALTAGDAPPLNRKKNSPPTTPLEADVVTVWTSLTVALASVATPDTSAWNMPVNASVPTTSCGTSAAASCGTLNVTFHTCRVPGKLNTGCTATVMPSATKGASSGNPATAARTTSGSPNAAPTSMWADGVPPAPAANVNVPPSAGAVPYTTVNASTVASPDPASARLTPLHANARLARPASSSRYTRHHVAYADATGHVRAHANSLDTFTWRCTTQRCTCTRHTAGNASSAAATSAAVALTGSTDVVCAVLPPAAASVSVHVKPPDTSEDPCTTTSWVVTGTPATASVTSTTKLRAGTCTWDAGGATSSPDWRSNKCTRSGATSPYRGANVTFQVMVTMGLSPYGSPVGSVPICTCTASGASPNNPANAVVASAAVESTRSGRTVTTSRVVTTSGSATSRRTPADESSSENASQCRAAHSSYCHDGTSVNVTACISARPGAVPTVSCCTSK